MWFCVILGVILAVFGCRYASQCEYARIRVPNWGVKMGARIRVPSWRPKLTSRYASRMSYLLRYNLGGSRGCVIVHTGGTPPVPPQNRGNSSASRLGENPNRVYPEGPGKLGTPQKWCFGGANWCKFVQICANLCNLGGPENPGK